MASQTRDERSHDLDRKAVTERDTGPGNGPLVSFVLATYNRPNDLSEAVASILRQEYRPIEIHIVSNSTDDTAELFEAGGRFDEECVHYHEFPGRMGVPQARNVGYDLASGDILVTVDDDAVLLNDDAATEVVRLFETNPDVGVLAFQCRNYYTGEVNDHETPDPPSFEMSPRESYRATNFVGVGNAIRRDAIERAGAFPDDFVYGFEEMDLSLRVHDTGYDILYTPTIVVGHKKSPEGRRTDTETLERFVENRIRIAVRNLPLRYVLFTSLIWGMYGALAIRKADSLRRIAGRLVADRDALLAERSVVDPAVIDRIKGRKTMLYRWWYGPHPGRILGRKGNPRRLFWEL